MDVDNLSPGTDFGDYIKALLPRCDAALVLIGPHWLDARAADGKRRLDDPNDLVRIEIETALDTYGLKVVPVLVNGAHLPAAADLPYSLRPLLRRHAAIVRRNPDFSDDVTKLIAALGNRTGALDFSNFGGVQKPDDQLHVRSSIRNYLVAGVIAILIAVLSMWQPWLHAVPSSQPIDVAVRGSSPAPSLETATPSTITSATQTLLDAAQGGDAVARYELGLQRLSEGHPEAAMTLLRLAADQGLVMAQYRIAKLYERGEGVPINLDTARMWTNRAAQGGNRRAMHDMGVYYARGEGAPLDEEAAARWFTKAAELGVADSQYNLGVLYQQGRGVAANASEAMYWFSVAAQQGDTDASAHARALEPTLTTIELQNVQARVSAFSPRPANAVANGIFGPRPYH